MKTTTAAKTSQKLPGLRNLTAMMCEAADDADHRNLQTLLGAYRMLRAQLVEELGEPAVRAEERRIAG